MEGGGELSEIVSLLCAPQPSNADFLRLLFWEKDLRDSGSFLHLRVDFRRGVLLGRFRGPEFIPGEKVFEAVFGLISFLRESLPPCPLSSECR